MRLWQALEKIVAVLSPRPQHHNWNVVIDRMVSPLDYDSIATSNKSKLDVRAENVAAWLRSAGLSQFVKSGSFEKKGLEFFFSGLALAINDQDVVLDAAGGRSSYLDALKGNGHRGKRYLNDHIFSGTTLRPDGVSVVGGDVADMHLEDASVDKIACHHAFEHFHSDKDTAFVREAFRILRPCGVLAITPLFLADKYVECWSKSTEVKYDPSATSLVDETASIPGRDNEGHFARIYDLESLNRRVIEPAETLGFKVEVIECEIGGHAIPDMERCFGSVLNRPLRVLLMRKL